MQVQTQNKIYYKGNPYTRQNYIPNSALKNRKQQNYLVQFPQGQSYFSVTRKKQYSGLHHQSQIKQLGLFQPQQTASYHHGTYQVADIEGAAPNTIISQAIRNRMKVYSRQNGRIIKKPRAIYNDQIIKSNEISQYEAQKNLLQPRKFSKNYHFHTEHRKMHTQPTEHHNNIQHQLDYKYNPQNKYIPQSTQTQSANIKQLQQMLFINQQNRLKQRSIIDQQKQVQPSIQKNPKIYSNINQEKDNIRLSQKKFHNLQSPKNNQRSVSDVKNMWHGDHHRILFPNRQIRRFNPTYLSSDNYINSGQVYSNYLGSSLI